MQFYFHGLTNERLLTVFREAHQHGGSLRVQEVGNARYGTRASASWPNSTIPNLIDSFQGLASDHITVHDWWIEIEDDETAVWFKMKYL